MSVDSIHVCRVFGTRSLTESLYRQPRLLSIAPLRPAFSKRCTVLARAEGPGRGLKAKSDASGPVRSVGRPLDIMEARRPGCSSLYTFYEGFIIRLRGARQRYVSGLSAGSLNPSAAMFSSTMAAMALRRPVIFLSSVQLIKVASTVSRCEHLPFHKGL